jgi:hypothetical protein
LEWEEETSDEFPESTSGREVKNGISVFIVWSVRVDELA